MPDLHTVTITTPGISGHGTVLTLDGQVVNGLTSIKLEIGMDEPNRLTLTMLVDGVNVQAEAEVEPDE